MSSKTITDREYNAREWIENNRESLMYSGWIEENIAIGVEDPRFEAYAYLRCRNTERKHRFWIKRGKFRARYEN